MRAVVPHYQPPRPTPPAVIYTCHLPPPVCAFCRAPTGPRAHLPRLLPSTTAFGPTLRPPPPYIPLLPSHLSPVQVIFGAARFRLRHAGTPLPLCALPHALLYHPTLPGLTRCRAYLHAWRPRHTPTRVTARRAVWLFLLALSVPGGFQIFRAYLPWTAYGYLATPPSPPTGQSSVMDRYLHSRACWDNIRRVLLRHSRAAGDVRFLGGCATHTATPRYLYQQTFNLARAAAAPAPYAPRCTLTHLRAVGF